MKLAALRKGRNQTHHQCVFELKRATQVNITAAVCRVYRGYLTWLLNAKELHLGDVSRKADSEVQWKENGIADPPGWLTERKNWDKWSVCVGGYFTASNSSSGS